MYHIVYTIAAASHEVGPSQVQVPGLRAAVGAPHRGPPQEGQGFGGRSDPPEGSINIKVKIVVVSM